MSNVTFVTIYPKYLQCICKVCVSSCSYTMPTLGLAMAHTSGRVSILKGVIILYAPLGHVVNYTSDEVIGSRTKNTCW